MSKPINFRPKDGDQIVIDLLMESGIYKNASDLVRTALWEMALRKYGDRVEKEVGQYLAETLSPLSVDCRKN